MPRQTERAIPRGEGAGDPVFTPQVGINTPGLAAQPQADQFSQLQQVLFNGLGDLAQGLASIGNAAEVVDNKKKQVLAQQERELAESSAGLEKTRYQQAQAEQRNIIMDERSANPQWLLEQAGTRLQNAGTEAEKEVWFRVAAAAKGELETQTKNAAIEAKREKVEDLNLAGLTASRVISTLETNLQTDVEQQQALIGDGNNIVKNVQDWVLSTVTDSGGELFNLREGASKDEVQARDKVMASLLAQSLNIADSLTKKYSKQLDQGKEAHALESLDALMLGVQKGTTEDPEVIKSTLQHIDQNYLNHLTSVEKKQFRSEYLNQVIKDAASLTNTADVTKANKAIDTYIAASGISPTEAARGREAADKILTQSANDQFTSLMDNVVASQRRVVPTKDGTMMVSMQSGTPEETLAAKNENGVSMARELADQYLTNAGIGPDRTNLGKSESLIRQNILDTVRQIEQRGEQHLTAAQIKQQKGDDARRNLTTGDSAAMYETNPLFLARSPNGITNDPALIAAVDSTGSQWGMSPDVPVGVGPVAMIPETRPARAVVMQAEAETWDKISVHTFPDAMLSDVANKFKSKSAEDMYDVTVMFRSLSQRKTNDFQKQIGSKLSMAEMIALDGLRHASLNPDEKTWDDAFTQARNIMENERLTPQAMDEGARDSYGKLIFEKDGPNRDQTRSRRNESLGLLISAFEEEAGAQMTAFGTDQVDTGAAFNEALRKGGGFTDSTLDFLAARHEALKGLGMDDVAAAKANKAMLKQDGYKVAAWGSEVKIIRDPQNVLGPGNLTETDTRAKIQAFLDSPLKGKALASVMTRVQKDGIALRRDADGAVIVPRTYWQAMKLMDQTGFGTMDIVYRDFKTSPAGELIKAPTDWVLSTDDSMWENYAFLQPVNGEPQAVAMLRFKDSKGNLRPITTKSGELVSAFSSYLVEQAQKDQGIE